jgi:hypothetical protein
MDLSTMGAKLEEGMYKDRFAFQADFRLMVNNAKTYNLVGSFVHNEAIALETFFEKRQYMPIYPPCVDSDSLTVYRMDHHQQDFGSCGQSPPSSSSPSPSGCGQTYSSRSSSYPQTILRYSSFSTLISAFYTTSCLRSVQ